MTEQRFADIEQALHGALQRIDHLERRADTLEAGLLRVERRIDLVYEQGQSNSKAMGALHAEVVAMREAATESRTTMDRVESLLKQLVHQQTPSVIT